MTGVIATIPKYQFSANGIPMVGGTLTTYVTGTSTPSATWQDIGLTSANTNPITLDSRGECTLFLDSAITYRFVLKNAAGVTQWTQDGISGTIAGSSITSLLADLASSAAGKGAELVGFSTLRNTKQKLNDIISRADYANDGDFNSAVGSKPSIDGENSFNAKVKPIGQQQTTLASALLDVPAGPRDAVSWAGNQSVKVYRNFATMGGFRFRGQYTKGRSPTFAMPTNKTVIMPTSLGAMSAATFENWYAVFACANAGDSEATLKVMPFLRALSVAGSTITLAKIKEGMSSLTSQTYAWSATNNLAGKDLLVIAENGLFSGRVANITANTNTTVSVGSIGSIAAGDTFLPSPAGFDHYVYLSSFYYDTAEVRNIADTGYLVKAKMINTVYPNTSTGSFPYPTFTGIDCTGYISPLAAGIVIDSSLTLSTTGVGGYAEYFASDGSLHTVQSAYYEKTTTSNETIVFDNIQVPFLNPQVFFYANAGGVAPSRVSGQFNVTGWFEL